jgi:dienelactone hydrolase
MKVISTLTLLIGTFGVLAAPSFPSPASELQSYFAAETKRLGQACMADIQSAADWTDHRESYRAQLREMLGLEPWPERTDLHPSITGRVEQPNFTVENVHFQSLPGLYVTGNLYLPKPRPTTPAPTILYLCGHGRVAKDGISYGNKVAYQHHGAWFARNGYVCLLIDTIQLGEIEGLHHGTYREGLWWWNSRGYTPAGVEAWNSIRALDFLATRPEVDTNRLGVTGRSGGGAYSWWLAALDERIRVAAPVAGITDLQNHVVDGVVEGHCDCMFTVNTYRWDYPLVAALVAPRPLLLVNTDHDSIFPFDGVTRVYQKLRRLYDLYQASDRLGLVIAPGPHKDTPDLQIPVFRWFNQHLKHEDPPIADPALKFSEPEPLKVFATLPADQRNTTIHESFVPKAPAPTVPKDADDWNKQKERWLEQLNTKVFRGWPDLIDKPSLELATKVVDHDLELRVYQLTTQPHVTLPLFTLRSTRVEPTGIRLYLIDDLEWNDIQSTLEPTFGATLNAFPSGVAATSQRVNEAELFNTIHQLAEQGWTLVWLAGRGVGPASWRVESTAFTQLRRRFMLLGQTLDGMRVWDTRRALQALRAWPGADKLHVYAHGEMACHAVYASLFEPSLAGLHLNHLPSSHQNGPDYLNVLRFLDIPQAVALAAEHHPIALEAAQTNDWQFPVGVVKQLGWPVHHLTFPSTP